ncbi:MAG: very short patch repair endonuclease [Coriobacteriia bacterium]
MDKISSKRRSWNMSRIRAGNTRIEILLRQALWADGMRGYRLHPKNVTGKPDLTYGRWKVAVFVDGCFWHACAECYREPSTNRDYWLPKIERNRQRDREVTEKLAEKGWAVVRLWEHQVEKDIGPCVRRIEQALASAGRSTH